MLVIEIIRIDCCDNVTSAENRSESTNFQRNCSMTVPDSVLLERIRESEDKILMKPLETIPHLR